MLLSLFIVQNYYLFNFFLLSNALYSTGLFLAKQIFLVFAVFFWQKFIKCFIFFCVCEQIYGIKRRTREPNEILVFSFTKYCYTNVNRQLFSIHFYHPFQRLKNIVFFFRKLLDQIFVSFFHYLIFNNCYFIVIIVVVDIFIQQQKKKETLHM